MRYEATKYYVGAAAGLCGGLLMGTVVAGYCAPNRHGGNASGTVIRAGRFELVDSRGTTRAVLGFSKDGTETELTLLDKGGKSQVVALGTDGDSSSRIRLTNRLGTCALDRSAGWGRPAEALVMLSSQNGTAVNLDANDLIPAISVHDGKGGSAFLAPTNVSLKRGGSVAGLDADTGLDIKDTNNNADASLSPAFGLDLKEKTGSAKLSAVGIYLECNGRRIGASPLTDVQNMGR